MDALFHCSQCADLYCRDCFAEWHVRGGRRNHVPIVLRAYTDTVKLPLDVDPQYSTPAGQELAKAFSPWFAFYDANNIRTFHDIRNGNCSTAWPTNEKTG